VKAPCGQEALGNFHISKKKPRNSAQNITLSPRLVVCALIMIFIPRSYVRQYSPWRINTSSNKRAVSDWIRRFICKAYCWKISFRCELLGRDAANSSMWLSTFNRTSNLNSNYFTLSQPISLKCIFYIFQGVKQYRRQADHWPLHTGEVKNAA
jgi:hypothetical protein